MSAAVARQVGCALEMCATSPPPKKLAARVPRVKSRYCDGSARSPGRISSRRLPTADTPITVRTPRLFSAQILARKLISPGSSWCCRPWRARNATSRPRGVPNSRMAYKPLPPMMPIMARCAPGTLICADGPPRGKMPESTAQQQLERGILMSSTPFPSLGPPRWPVRLLDVGLWLIGAGLLLCLICGPSHRFGLASFRVALLLLAGTLLAIVGMLVASAQRLRFARGPAMVAIVIGLLASGYLLSWIARARAAPPIHEISTDLADPPAFVAVAALRRDAHAVNPSEYVSRVNAPGGRIIEVPELQRQRYPDIQPLHLELAPAAALQAAQRAAQRLGWQIDAYVPGDGRLEATDSSAFFGFKDDVVVRVRASEAGSRLDVRSKSRVGLSDVGANARRVRAFLKLMESN